MGEEEGTSDLGGINLSLWGKGTQAGVKSQVKGFRSMWSSPGGTAGSLESPEGAGNGRVLVRETLAGYVMHRAFDVMWNILDYTLSALGSHSSVATSRRVKIRHVLEEAYLDSWVETGERVQWVAGS